MKSPITKVSAAAMVVIIGLCFTLLNQTAMKAYAIEQTIEAIDKVETVYFKAELYKQGDIECWMKFDGTCSKPTHVCLFMTGRPHRKIDSPAGSFGYNTVTNRYQVNKRDERKMNWYPDFSNFFKKSLKTAQESGNVQIASRMDPETQKEMIVVTVSDKNRTAEYWIDPKSKLPVRFNTLKTVNFMKFYKKTIALRNMSKIVYNQSPPEGIFYIPEDAEKMTNEHDVFVHPGIGMPFEDLTHQQACEKIARQVVDQMNARDWQGVSKLMFPFGAPPKEMQAMIPSDLSIKLVKIIEIGKAYERDGYWYLPMQSKEFGGKIKDEQVPIKFYEFDGKKFCMIMWPD